MAIGLVSLFSLVLEADAVEREVFGFFQTYLPGSDGILATNVEAVGNIRGLLGIISALGLLYSSSLLFGAITRAVNRAWDIPYDRPFYIEKPRHIIMTLSVAPLFVLSITATTALQFIGSEEIPVLERLAFLEHNGINTLARPLPFVFSLLIFLLIYKFAPYTRTYWRYVWPGALLAAFLFDVGKSAFVFYLENYATYEKVLRHPGFGHSAAGLDLYVRHDSNHRRRGFFRVSADAYGRKPGTACAEPSPEEIAFSMRCQLTSVSLLRPCCAVVCHYAASF